MHISIIMAVFVTSLIAMLIVRMSHRKRSPLKSVLLVLSTSALVISGMLAIGFEWCAEKVCMKTSFTPSKVTALAKIKNTSYYLILDDEEYKYLCRSDNGEDRSQRVDRINCEVTYSNELPRMISKEVTKDCRKEWLFLVGETQEENEAAYEFIIPSEESILDTGRLERTPAGP